VCSTGGVAARISLYSAEMHRLETDLGSGFSPQWLPDSRRVALFNQERIGVLDLDSRRLHASAFTAPPGVWVPDVVLPRLSRDGSTLYMRQAQEQGDIWIVRWRRQ
jgi:hypothetical protein